MKTRTQQFALRIVRLSAALPKTREADVLGRQVLRSGTSIGANYREAVRASSRRHFITNLETCLREGDETLYWLELLAEAGIVPASRLADLLDECNQLVAIITATVRTTKQNSAAKHEELSTTTARKSRELSKS
ncbi:MAG: four helix bundle protein [Planctomycetota bacterium]|nr:MAG: four helix bundle protein [Planctomycetota bacterium]